MQRNKWAFSFVITTLVLLIGAKLALEPVVKARQAHRPNLKPIEAGYHGRSLKKLSPGLDSFLAGLLWIQLLQQAAYTPVREGEVSWEFAQLDAISTLEPKFERAYDYGHAFLSVFRRDKLGAKILLEKWVHKRTNYWKPHYLYGYHLFFEMNDYGRAAPAILRASQMDGAPPWLASLGIRLLEEDLALEQALRLALEIYPQTTSPIARDALRTRIRVVRFTREKQRLEKQIREYRAKHGSYPRDLAQVMTVDSEISRTLSSLQFSAEDAAEIAPLVREKFPFAYEPAVGTVKAAKQIQWLETAQVGIYKPKSEEAK